MNGPPSWVDTNATGPPSWIDTGDGGTSDYLYGGSSSSQSGSGSDSLTYWEEKYGGGGGGNSSSNSTAPSFDASAFLPDYTQADRGLSQTKNEILLVPVRRAFLLFCFVTIPRFASISLSFSTTRPSPVCIDRPNYLRSIYIPQETVLRKEMCRVKRTMPLSSSRCLVPRFRSSNGFTSYPLRL